MSNNMIEAYIHKWLKHIYINGGRRTIAREDTIKWLLVNKINSFHKKTWICILFMIPSIDPILINIVNLHIIKTNSIEMDSNPLPSWNIAKSTKIQIRKEVAYSRSTVLCTWLLRTSVELHSCNRTLKPILASSGVATKEGGIRRVLDRTCPLTLSQQRLACWLDQLLAT